MNQSKQLKSKQVELNMSTNPMSQKQVPAEAKLKCAIRETAYHESIILEKVSILYLVVIFDYSLRWLLTMLSHSRTYILMGQYYDSLKARF